MFKQLLKNFLSNKAFAAKKRSVHPVPPPPAPCADYAPFKRHLQALSEERPFLQCFTDLHCAPTKRPHAVRRAGWPSREFLRSFAGCESASTRRTHLERVETSRARQRLVSFYADPLLVVSFAHGDRVLQAVGLNVDPALREEGAAPPLHATDPYTREFFLVERNAMGNVSKKAEKKYWLAYEESRQAARRTAIAGEDEDDDEPDVAEFSFVNDDGQEEVRQEEHRAEASPGYVLEVIQTRAHNMLAAVAAKAPELEEEANAEEWETA